MSKLVFGVNMTRYISRYEASVRERLWVPLTRDELLDLLEEHSVKIGWLQHERLIHLLVTMLFAVVLVFLLGLILILPAPGIWLLILAFLVLSLLAAYVAHYFRLENSVQRWYVLYDEIKTRILDETEG